ncbi:uncharacterized protein BDR25DRAFT_356416 [Lindgomyces ingoldianus]|uniref:Uncharacterized protein n=1 Tax=Lindgomyces ingoldianus TaxID=673940 RepID=A0ACB6QS10_9PLEO|nr:uncharacterized protein BDR25DRAFT_356416 [Lindgomyces ingoldianus]KAF2469680.1 hypothetical protein BDR25DRAFT_356416 [Lindgomyces ingoldianus]
MGNLVDDRLQQYPLTQDLDEPPPIFKQGYTNGLRQKDILTFRPQRNHQDGRGTQTGLSRIWVCGATVRNCQFNANLNIYLRSSTLSRLAATWNPLVFILPTAWYIATSLSPYSANTYKQLNKTKPNMMYHDSPYLNFRCTQTKLCNICLTSIQPPAPRPLTPSLQQEELHRNPSRCMRDASSDPAHVLTLFGYDNLYVRYFECRIVWFHGFLHVCVKRGCIKESAFPRNRRLDFSLTIFLDFIENPKPSVPSVAMLSPVKSVVLSLSFLSAFVAAAPAAEADAGVELTKRGSWDAIVYSGPNCNSGSATKVHGEGGGCYHPGGQSINIQLNGGCKWKSYSGTNCAGSNKGLGGGCNKVTFGSYLWLVAWMLEKGHSFRMVMDFGIAYWPPRHNEIMEI